MLGQRTSTKLNGEVGSECIAAASAAGQNWRSAHCRVLLRYHTKKMTNQLLQRTSAIPLLQSNVESPLL